MKKRWITAHRKVKMEKRGRKNENKILNRSYVVPQSDSFKWLFKIKEHFKLFLDKFAFLVLITLSDIIVHNSISPKVFAGLYARVFFKNLTSMCSNWQIFF